MGGHQIVRKRCDWKCVEQHSRGRERRCRTSSRDGEPCSAFRLAYPEIKLSDVWVGISITQRQSWTTKTKSRHKIRNNTLLQIRDIRNNRSARMIRGIRNLQIPRMIPYTTQYKINSQSSTIRRANHGARLRRVIRRRPQHVKPSTHCVEKRSPAGRATGASTFWRDDLPQTSPVSAR
jgi:hypothetical protein